jgi:hypothetical protein
MSALGQKHIMSALPPKADMCGAARDVRFGPIADISLAHVFRPADHSSLLANRWLAARTESGRFLQRIGEKRGRTIRI